MAFFFVRVAKLAAIQSVFVLIRLIVRLGLGFVGLFIGLVFTVLVWHGRLCFISRATAAICIATATGVTIVIDDGLSHMLFGQNKVYIFSPTCAAFLVVKVC